VLSWCGILLGFTRHNRGLINIPSSTVHVFSPRFAHQSGSSGFQVLLQISVACRLWCWCSCGVIGGATRPVMSEKVTSGVPGSGIITQRRSATLCHATHNATQTRSIFAQINGKQRAQSFPWLPGGPARVGHRVRKSALPGTYKLLYRFSLGIQSRC
jgi:hypothetical protein